jgi:glycosyltransferase involved in cell wall biosynthesis
MMQKNIKVCHIISAFHRHDTRIFWKQCRSLAKAGFEVTLLANDSGSDEVKENVRIVTTGISNTSRFQRMLLSRRSLYKKAYEIDADIYEVHDPEILPLGLKLLKKGKYVVFDSHEDFPNQLLEKDWIPMRFRKVLSWMAKSYYDRNIKKFSAVLSVTPHIVDSLKNSSDNVHLITNFPIIEENFKVDSLEEYLQRKPQLCYAGTIYTTSMQENILEALNDIEFVRYIMVGTIEENYLNLLARHKSWSRVNFIKRVSKEDLMKIYHEVTIGIVLFDYSPNVGYKRGSLGNNKIFEYMHSGLPIICTDFELWQEIINKYKCGICVNPHNIDEIRNAISYLTDNKAEAYEMGQNGRKAVLNEYNWNSQEKVYVEIFRKLT